MFQDLDDPQPLARSSEGQRQAVISRGKSLRRRRQARAIGLPVAAAALAASAVVALAVVPGPSKSEVLTPAAPTRPELTLQEPAQTGEPAYGGCSDPVGDSAGEPDVANFGLDRPRYPLVHYSLVAGEMPSTGLVEFSFEATSADRRRSRHLVQRIVDGTVVEQYLLDPSTGARRDVPRSKNPYGDPGDHGVGGADFPGGALSGLGDGWTWVASLSINGTVVDSCDAEQSQP